MGGVQSGDRIAGRFSDSMCYSQYAASLKCLEEHPSDKSKCKVQIDAYKECKKHEGITIGGQSHGEEVNEPSSRLLWVGFSLSFASSLDEVVFTWHVMKKARREQIPLALPAKGELSEEEDEGPQTFSRRALQSTGRLAKSLVKQEDDRGENVEDDEKEITKDLATFEDLGVDEWLAKTCMEMGLKRPSPVQRACVPQVLAGRDCLGIAQTGSGKTAAFALPILQLLAQNTYGVFALVLTPTRELAFQIAEQFRVLGSGIHLRCAVVIGGMGMLEQCKALLLRPHVVIATPGRLNDILVSNPGISEVFSRAKFLVFDEADRLLDVGFEDEIRGVLSVVPVDRQTLLFSATMTSNLEALQELSLNKAFVYQAYEGLKTVETLEQKYLFIPANVKEVPFYDVSEKLPCFGFFEFSAATPHANESTFECKPICLKVTVAQSHRLAALKRFKSSQVSILIATDVASRGLDIPTVDLVINYDIPRYARDYVHRVGRTARAGRGGRAVSLVTQYDVELVHEIEALIGKKLEEWELDEDNVLKGITKVYKAKRAASMALADSGFEDKLKDRKKEKKTLPENSGSRKRVRS